VFSLAATWVALGHTGVILYEEVRQLAKNRYIEAQRAQNQASQISEGDQFHDGRNVLEAVTNWHQYLRNVLRGTDTITSEVLDLVDNEMLLGSADQRTNASDIHSKLQSILEKSPRSSEPQLPENLKTLLGEVDQEASCKAAKLHRSRRVQQASSNSSETIKLDARKPYLAERPLKTTHRQSFWPNQDLRLHDGKYLENQGLHLQIVPEPQYSLSETHQTPDESTNHYRKPSDSTIPTTPSRPRRSRNTTKHPPRNIFQAWEELDRREHERRRYTLKHPFSKKEDFKDGLLTAHFGGTRDIVSLLLPSTFKTAYNYNFQIFLVDNAESMGENWHEATYVLDVLVKMAKGLDPDGMDLRFTRGPITLDGKDSASKFKASMEAARPKTSSKERARTDLRSSLGNILQDYLSKLREKEKRPMTKVKDTVLLVLTDGIWAGMEDKDGVGEQIKDFAKELKALHHHLKLRPFSIEFIQFGNDDSATQRLRYLDDYLHREGIP